MDSQKINNPFIGLRTYEETEASLFRGRKSSTLDLYRMIIENDVIVLHAESGEGKSSLLNAGLSPMLREERYFPIKINFTEEDYKLDAPDFNLIVYNRIVDTINHINGSHAGTTVFKDTPDISGKVSIIPIDKSETSFTNDCGLNHSIWWQLRNNTLNAYGAMLTPVLVFDQFEEVFTRPKSNAWTEDFFIWLSATLCDDIPRPIIRRIREEIGEEAVFPKIQTAKRFKALFSLRTEFMGELDYWGIQRHHISVLKNSRFCLKPLTEDEADEVLALQPAFSDDTKKRIKDSIYTSQSAKQHATSLPVIPAMLLSVVSTTITNDLAQKGQDYGKEALDKGSGSDTFTNIIEQFYDKEIADSGISPSIIRQIEDVLVDDKGKRVRIKADTKDLRDIKFVEMYKPILEKKRLIKCSRINNDEYVELTHDALAKVVAKRRLKRNENRNKLKEWGLHAVTIFTLILGISILRTLMLYIGQQHLLFIDNIPFFGKCGINLFIVKSSVILLLGTWIVHILGKRGKFKSILAGFVYFLILFLGSLILIPELRISSYIYFDLIKISLLIAAHITLIGVCCLTSILFVYGLYLCESHNKKVKIAGIIFLSIPIIYLFFIYFKQIQIILIFAAIFKIAPIIYTKTRSSAYILFVTAAFLVLISILGESLGFDFTSGMLLFMGLWLAIVGCGCMFYKKKQPVGLILKKLMDEHIADRQPLLYQFHIIFWIIALLIVSHFIGDMMSAVYSLLGLLIICPALVFLLLKLSLKYRIHIDCKHYFYLLSVILSATVLMWLLQFTTDHFIATICTIIISFAIIQGINIHNKTIDRKRGIYPTLDYLTFGIGILLIPYLIFGYNFICKDNYKRVFGETVAIYYETGTRWQTPIIRLQLIQDKDSKLGIRDQYGNIVVKPTYDSLLTYDNAFYSNSSYEYTGDFGIVFTKDGKAVKWDIYDHLHEQNKLTDKFYDNLIQSGTEYSLYNLYSMPPQISSAIIGAGISRDRSGYKEVAKTAITNIIKSAINYSNLLDEDNKLGEFDSQDTTHLELLRAINYANLPWELLPYSSNNFKHTFYRKILPNTTLINYSINGENHDKIIKCGNFFDLYLFGDHQQVSQLQRRLSEEQKAYVAEDTFSYHSGNLLTLTAKSLLLGGNFDEAKTISKFAYDNYKFAEPALPIHIAAMLLNGELDEAIKLLSTKKDELVRINSGLGYPDPSKENAWYFLRYKTMLQQVEQIIHLSERYGAVNSKKAMKIYGVLDEQKHGSQYENFPEYDEIQIIQQSNDQFLRFIKNDDDFNGEYIYGYSYQTVTDSVASPLITVWSYGACENDTCNYPFLTIDYTTNKRRFIKSKDGSLWLTKYHKWDFLVGEYSHAWPFHEGLAAVEVNGKIGFIDVDGSIVISPRFSSPYKVISHWGKSIFGIYSTRGFKIPCFRNGVCPVYDENGELHWINKNGDYISLPE